MNKRLLPLLLFLAAAVCACAAEKPADKSDKKPGPNGGRVLVAAQTPLEFFVLPDRKVQVCALTPELKETPLSGQTLSVTAGDRSKPVKLEFKEAGGKLVSTNSLPEGNDYPVSVGIKSTGTAKTVYEKFNLNLAKCPTCKYLEYACICAH